MVSPIVIVIGSGSGSGLCDLKNFENLHTYSPSPIVTTIDQQKCHIVPIQRERNMRGPHPK
jgi:hypothetical protein